jgi:hypothetical protein
LFANVRRQNEAAQIEAVCVAFVYKEAMDLPRFDASDFENLRKTMKRYLDDFPGDIICPLQIWYEALGAYGVPSAQDVRAMEAVLGELPDWKDAGEIRYEKFGKQHSYRRTAAAPVTSEPHNIMVQHLFKVNGLYRGPDGKVLKIALAEVYNLRCFEVVDGNLVGPMIKIKPTSDYAKKMTAIAG